MIILSHFQAARFLQAREDGQDKVECSLDLEMTATMVALTHSGVALPDGQLLSWSHLAEIAANESACYLVEKGEIQRIKFFSDYLNRVYTLYPTQSAPTMLVSGIPMHRIKGIDPRQDTQRKIKALGPIRGRVLDTTMGLGYTAIEAAKMAEAVITIELDPTVVKLCRLNPWSQALFDNPRIQRIIGDAYEEVTHFEKASFSGIIHDPPTFNLAGELYSETFYRELYRLLKHRGRLFHYIGDLQSKSGKGVARGAAQRLQAAGFQRVVPKPRAFGLLAYR